MIELLPKWLDQQYLEDIVNEHVLMHYSEKHPGLLRAKEKTMTDVLSGKATILFDLRTNQSWIKETHVYSLGKRQ